MESQNDEQARQLEVESEGVELQPVAANAFEWRYSSEAGVAADGPAVAFDSQQIAEQWLAENGAGLLESGVAAVSLFDGSKVRYGPMPLQAD